jgi:hypothetical protein
MHYLRIQIPRGLISVPFRLSPFVYKGSRVISCDVQAETRRSFGGLIFYVTSAA